MNNAIKIVSVLSCTFTLLSCGGHGGGKKETEAVTTSRESYLSEASCAFTPDQGANYYLPLREEKRKSYFNKEYNYNWLKMVGPTSLRYTYQAIKDQGVKVLAAKTSQDEGCPFTDIPRASSHYQNVFTGSSSDILGLYLPKYDLDLVGDDKYMAHIIVWDMVDKWTLVHEFMHHNFQTNRDKNEEKCNSAQLQIYLDRLKDYATTPVAGSERSVRDWERATENFVNFSSCVQYIVKNYAFEEYTIEKMLLASEERGELDVVAPIARENAKLYAEFGLKKGMKMLEPAESGLSTLYTLLLTTNPRGTDNRNKLEAVSKSKNAITDLYKEANRLMLSKSSMRGSAIASKHSTIKSTCPKMIEVDKAINILEQNFNF